MTKPAVSSVHYQLDLREHVEDCLQSLINDAELNGWNPNIYRLFRRLNEAWMRAEREAFPASPATTDGYDFARVRQIPPAKGFPDDRKRVRLRPHR